MVAYSFKRRFVLPIQVGLGLPFDPVIDLDPPSKRQTIRADRAGNNRHARPGETVQLYCGLRTKNCFKIGEACCVSIEPIRIDFEYRYLPSWPAGRIEYGDPFHVCQGQENLDDFARRDGFANWLMMKTFWEEYHGLAPFLGVLIKWEPLT